MAVQGIVPQQGYFKKLTYERYNYHEKNKLILLRSFLDGREE